KSSPKDDRMRRGSRMLGATATESRLTVGEFQLTAAGRLHWRTRTRLVPSIRLTARFPEGHASIEELVHHVADQYQDADERDDNHQLHLGQLRRLRCWICSSAVSSASRYTGFGSTFPLSHPE